MSGFEQSDEHLQSEMRESSKAFIIGVKEIFISSLEHCHGCYAWADFDRSFVGG